MACVFCYVDALDTLPVLLNSVDLVLQEKVKELKKRLSQYIRSCEELLSSAHAKIQDEVRVHL